MNNAYADITMSTGAHTGGTCSFKMAPREWLVNDVLQNFNTGIVTTALNIGSNTWIEGNCVFNTMELTEKPKQNRVGTYFQQDLGGVVNTDDAITRQLLETYRYHEWIIIYKDKKAQLRIIGNKETGMFFTGYLKHQSKSGGQSFYEISLYRETEETAPFYTP